ncbi:hypothetical protein N7471_013759 [Penicillium samsonianum]|uniref:uncharacterized protein n=1 Tax=Penicillium samsonianum TaxID=1882272 RepID=UPI002548AB4D|nr:uncharacterized protein N7471_013759 [Penicillium samsonianum]KAJ6118292.1 hypothetical protein N7471_013759 [Penicillium samsonianum]
MALNITTFNNVINNELTSTAKTRHGTNPANRQPNPEVPVSTAEDLDRAVTAARQAFRQWSKTSFNKRRAAIKAFAGQIEANKDALAALLTQEQGKPLDQSHVEVGKAVQWCLALSAIKIPETVVQDNEEAKITQRYVPMGVAGAIVPWNFPVLLAIGKIVPAIYTASSLVSLPPAASPPGVMQVLSGGDDLGPMITEHPGINKISFTGSIATGRRVMASCAKTLKRVTLELGGNDPAIICDDIDIDAVIPKVAILSFLCSSQICMMIKRLYVHEKIYDQFRDKLVQFVQALKVGEGTEPDVFFGPIQNSMQFDKAKDLLCSIASDGLKPVLGGTITDSSGYFVTPTIIDNPPETSRVVQEEPFAPILPILKWTDEEDVLTRANAAETGLGASVWSKDLSRAKRMADQLEAGSVWINSHFDVTPEAPFGGHKASGMDVVGQEPTTCVLHNLATPSLRLAFDLAFIHSNELAATNQQPKES